MEAIGQRIQTARVQMVDPRRPIGVFMMVGPSGVGKTETAMALADILYGGDKNMVVINMSEYQESHTVSSLKGSPPGYVGYGEGGVLAEALRPELLKVFKPAFLGRMVVVPYYPLADDVIRQIIKLQLSRIADRFRQNHRAEFVYDDAVIEAVRNRCKEVESGARNVDSILTGKLLPEISRQILGRMAEGLPMTQAKVSVDGSGNF